MGNWLLSITIVIYAGVAIDYAVKGQLGMCLAFVAYAVANIGFILANMKI